MKTLMFNKGYLDILHNPTVMAVMRLDCDNARQ